MFQVQRYAYINARLRSRLSYLLDKSLLVKMIQAGSLEESLAHLRGTYYDDFYQSYQQSGDLILAEQAFTQSQMRLLSHLSLGLSASVQDFMKSLLMMHETALLKTALRVWFYREILQKPLRSISLPSGQMLLAYDISYETLMASATLDEMREHLKETPYAQILHAHEATILSDRTLYALEVALDRYVFTDIQRVIHLLPAGERIMMQQLMGAYIDMENLQFGRGLVAYHVDKNVQMEAEFLSGGSRLQPKLWMDVIHDEDQLRKLLVEWYPALTAHEEEPISLLLMLAERELLYTSGKRALSYPPFSCAPIVAYFFLVEHDRRTILSIINAKVYAISSDQIMQMTRLE
ncbi:V-type ATPase subunit [Entomospira culicis]|uniref:V-type ATPase subunit n=1 Tax=Entomospira culicis TaxID=2719989 RepID=A0A968KTN5_9SPIO|nr:V-type ATPase subunit [Entomospira culicis]NIZ18428.1 V-type ATPase subunit [Entomospira culicis]NIZ68644.1 V-type ATPase subunit [Entomospira culicis]WDI37244.1 V-type ATPase subunit [Entomospira culicis]WDI38872.1 V-type ATPase subunit [Entomospira culicis]